MKKSNIEWIFKHNSEKIFGIFSFLFPKGNVKPKSGVINPTLYDLKRASRFF